MSNLKKKTIQITMDALVLSGTKLCSNHVCYNLGWKRAVFAPQRLCNPILHTSSKAVRFSASPHISIMTLSVKTIYLKDACNCSA